MQERLSIWSVSFCQTQPLPCEPRDRRRHECRAGGGAGGGGGGQRVVPADRAVCQNVPTAFQRPTVPVGFQSELSELQRSVMDV